MSNTWELVIGLEVHVQLATRSKLFSGAATAYGAAPNTQACAIDMGLPGVLPVLNTEALRMAIRFGLAIQADIASKSIFARKNYFYPDLPKGYQISQMDDPIVGKGQFHFYLEDGSPKVLAITRAHLEEDAGKSYHEGFEAASGIDLNRAGIPLLEIVSEPDLRSAEEAVAYLKALHSLVRYLEISDGNMQEGSFRCDANVSVRPQGSTVLGTRAEIKNVNSFRFVEKAIRYEMERQINVLENGGTLIQETRLYDAALDQTRSMRNKETANDYRYFPDPDLLPVVVDQALIEEIRQTLPELPMEKAERFKRDYGLSAYDVSVLTSDKALAAFFEATLAAMNSLKATSAPTTQNQTTEALQHHAASLQVTLEGSAQDTAKLCANWIMGECLAALRKNNLDIQQCPIDASILAKLLCRIQDQTISGKIAKGLFEELWNNPVDVDTLIAQKGLMQISDPAIIESIVDQILAAHPKQCLEYQQGNERLLGFFVGQAMKAGKGQLHPERLNEILKKLLNAKI